MSSRITIEETTLAFAFQNGTTLELCKELLLYLMDERNIVYASEGLVKLIVRLTKKSRRSIEQAIQALIAWGFMEKFDEFSCRVNPKFAVRTTKIPVYEGKEAEFTKDENDSVFEANIERVKSWKARGTYVHTQKETPLMKMLKKELSDLKKQNEDMQKALDFLVARAKGEDAQEAQTMLRLVKNDE